MLFARKFLFLIHHSNSRGVEPPRDEDAQQANDYSERRASEAAHIGCEPSDWRPLPATKLPEPVDLERELLALQLHLVIVEILGFSLRQRGRDGRQKWQARKLAHGQH